MLHIRLTPWLAALAALSIACGDDGLGGSQAALDAEADDASPGDDGDAAPGDDADATPDDEEEPPTDDCASFSCSEHGFCMPSEGEVHCACSAGYAGEHCETCAPGFVLGGSPARCAATLSATRPEPAGEHCPHGGAASESGADLDGNGALDAAEVTATEYLCNAAPPGVECEEDTCGGHGACAETDRGATCLCDSAYDGRACELCADGFVTSRDGACIRPHRLTVEQLEARGPRCAAGGVAISRGLDLDDDGQLSSDEIERTDYVCNTPRVRTGDVLIRGQAELDDLTGVTEIVGNLRITAPYITALEPLSSLGRVSGNVIIESNPRLESLAGLDALYEVGGWLAVQQNPQLKTATGFGALDRVYGAFILESNPNLERVDLGGLQTVGGSLSVNAPLLTELLGGNLVSVVGSLAVSAGPGLIDISGLGRLDAVGYELSVTGSSLPNLAALEQLREVGGLVLTNHAAITSVSLPQLRAVRGRLIVAANDHLASVGPFPALIHVDSSLLINENPELTSIEGFRQLEHAGSLGIAGNPQLATIDAFTALTTLSSSHEVRCEWLDCLNWGSNTSAGLELRALPALSRLNGFANLSYAASGVTLSGLPALESMPDIPGVTAMHGTLRVADVALTRLPLRALTELGSLYIGQNPRLESLAILDGVYRAGDMYIVDNDQLTDAGTWPLLTTAYRLEVAGNAVLPELPTLPLVTTLYYGLRVEDNAVLRGTTGLPALTSIGNDWTTPRYNFALPSEADEEPRGAAVTLLVRGNPALTSLSFLSHLTQTSYVGVVDNDALAAVDLPALTSVSSLFVVDNAQVSSVSLAAPRVYRLDVEANAALTSLATLEMRVDDFILASTPLEELSATLVGNVGRVTLRQSVTSANLAALGSGSISELVIQNTSLTSLAGLQITGAYALSILDNDELTSLDGLGTLVSLGNLTIDDNDALTSLDGLGTLGSVGYLTIDDNDILRSVAGLGAKASSGLGVHNNPVLPTCAAESLAGPDIWGVDISGNDDAGVCE